MEQKKHDSRVTASTQREKAPSSGQQAVDRYLSRLSSFGPDKVLSQRMDEVRKGPRSR